MILTLCLFSSRLWTTINLSDEGKAYVMAGDWGFIPKIRSPREYQRYRQGVRAARCQIDGGAAET